MQMKSKKRDIDTEPMTAPDGRLSLKQFEAFTGFRPAGYGKEMQVPGRQTAAAMADQFMVDASGMLRTRRPCKVRNTEDHGPEFIENNEGLTAAQIHRQCEVDNQIFELMDHMISAPGPFDWNIEEIATVRDAIKDIAVAHDVDEMTFYPYILDKDDEAYFAMVKELKVLVDNFTTARGYVANDFYHYVRTTD